MPVAVERGVNRGVTELSLNILRRDALVDEHRRACVSQVMETDTAQTGRFQATMKLPLDNVVMIERAASCCGEHQPEVVVFSAGLQFFFRLQLMMSPQ